MTETIDWGRLIDFSFIIKISKLVLKVIISKK